MKKIIKIVSIMLLSIWSISAFAETTNPPFKPLWGYTFSDVASASQGPSDSPSSQLVYDSDGNLYVYSNIVSTAGYNPEIGVPLSLNSNKVGLLTKISPDGKVLWVRQFSSNGDSGVTQGCLAFDPASRSVFVSAFFSSQLTVNDGNGHSVATTDGVNSISVVENSDDAFLAKISLDGELTSLINLAKGDKIVAGSVERPVQMLIGGKNLYILFQAENYSGTSKVAILGREIAIGDSENTLLAILESSTLELKSLSVIKDLIPNAMTYAKGKTFILGGTNSNSVDIVSNDGSTTNFEPNGKYLIPTIGIVSDPLQGITEGKGLFPDEFNAYQGTPNCLAIAKNGDIFVGFTSLATEDDDPILTSITGVETKIFGAGIIQFDSNLGMKKILPIQTDDEYNAVKSIVLDSDENIYITGEYNGETFDAFTPNVQSHGAVDLYVAKVAKDLSRIDSLYAFGSSSDDMAAPNQLIISPNGTMLSFAGTSGNSDLSLSPLKNSYLNTKARFLGSIKLKDLEKFTLNATVVGGHGSLQILVNNEIVANPATLPKGTRFTLKAIPDDGYQVKGWTINGKSVPFKKTDYSLVLNVSLDVNVEFEKVAPTPETKFLLEAVSNDSNLGSIIIKDSAKDQVIQSGDSVLVGTKLTFIATPSANGKLDGWIMNGRKINSTKQTLEMKITEALVIDGKFSLQAIFSAVNSVANITPIASIWTSKGYLYTNAPIGEKISIYNLEGQLLLHTIQNRSEQAIHLDRGIYIVRIGTKNFKVNL